jgi:uncharacterized membrane protein
MLSLLAAVYPILPINGEPFSELGVLGPNQKIGGYPTNVTVGQQFTLYGYIGNHEGRPSYYQFVVKVGNQSTAVSNSTTARAPTIFVRYQLLNDNSSVTFPLTLSLQSPGINQRIIFELWSFNSTTSQFVYTGLWDQIWVNSTVH